MARHFEITVGQVVLEADRVQPVVVVVVPVVPVAMAISLPNLVVPVAQDGRVISLAQIFSMRAVVVAVLMEIMAIPVHVHLTERLVPVVQMLVERVATEEAVSVIAVA